MHACVIILLHSQFGRAADPRLVGQVGEPDAALVRERVVLRQHEVHRVLEQVVVHDALAVAVARLAGADRDREVDVAGAQRDDRVLGLHQRHRQLDAGVLARRSARSRSA